MNRLFYAGVLCLALFEAANVYFIMPMPGSQRMRSIDALRRPDAATSFALSGDSLVSPGRAYALSGRGADDSLATLPASQEFWHSWRTFHPDTKY